MALIDLSGIINFANLTTALLADLDTNFTKILTEINGNLDETNVKMAADSKKLNGFLPEKTTPAVDKVPVAGAAGHLARGYMTAFQGALVTNSGALSLAGAAAALSFDTETYDTDTIHDAGTPTKLTVPTGVTRVRLVFNCRILFGSDDEYIELVLRKGGVSTNILWAQNYKTMNGLYASVMLVSPVLTVAATNYFEMYGVRSTAADVVAGAQFAMEVIE